MIDQLYFSQLEKQYIPYMRSLVLEERFQPIVLRGGKNKPATTAELHHMIRLFQANEKNQNNKGWIIEWEQWYSKKLGQQQWPSEIQVDTEDDFLYLIKKENEAAAFKTQLNKLLQWNPVIRKWLASKPKLVLELQEAWEGICSVVDYLLRNEVKGQYLRSIPVPVHTKFIEQYKRHIYSLLQHLNSNRFSLPDTDFEDALFLSKKPFLFTLRWLDDNLSIKYTSGLHLFAAPTLYLQQQSWKIERIILVENETNLYLFPSLPGVLVICSHGKALHLLKEIEFLNHTELYYWGDLDEQGFAMLNDMRNYYNHITSLFMDEATLSHHEKELNSKTTRYKRMLLPLLQPPEHQAYEILLSNNQWLEQERLQQVYVQHKLLEIFGEMSNKPTA